MPIGDKGKEIGDADDPGSNFFVITPSNTDADMAQIPRAILIDADAIVAVVGLNDETNESVALPLLGQVWHPMKVRRVLVTGTTATTIWGCR